MFVQQFFVRRLVHNLYLLSGTNVCDIINPEGISFLHIDEVII